MWAVDGSYKASDDPGAATMGRGAARHDGRTLSVALESAGDDSAYLAEFVAQLDVLAAEGCSRAMVLFDCTSPVEALNTFVRAHDRHKVDYRRDELHSTWLQLLARFDVVVLVHVYSQGGAPERVGRRAREGGAWGGEGGDSAGGATTTRIYSLWEGGGARH